MTSSAPMIFLTPKDSEASCFKSGAFKVLYVYTIDDGKHTGRLKVGDATFHTTQTLQEIIDESEAANPFRNFNRPIATPGITAAAIARIDQQTKTADVEYTLLWAILAVRPVYAEGSTTPTYVPFRDHDVHNILKRNMIGTSHHRSDKKVGEWFETDLSVIQDAVNFLQTGVKSENFMEAETSPEVTLRREQKDAVSFTKRHFKNGTPEKPKEILWSAIMRFGKTLTTYETVRQSSEIKKVLIVTHRPVVADGWYTDFNKIFGSGSGVHFSSKRWGEKWEDVRDQTDFFYFASIQDLRGSFPGDETKDPKKNAEIFSTDWDLIVTDEAHEGTSTLLAETMYDNLKAKYWLHLSGTPFNIVEDFEQTHIYKWDYIDEQKARKQWAIDYPLDSNPYDRLPTIEIFTYDISENLKRYKDASTLGFDFGKFFKVTEETAVSKSGKTYRKFRDEEAVWKLLNLMTRSDEYEDDKREFPFSTSESLDIFNHTFWLIPSVESSLALEEMLSRHPVFRNYAVVNVTADNFEGDSALVAVQKAIRENKRTITLSYGRLTTGVTVPEWTGVLLMSNLQSPMTYMQTIFRVKSGGILPNGQTKEKGYVFDFAPDRTLTMVAHASQLTRDSIDEKREAVEELLEYLPIHYTPIIADDGSRFKRFDTVALMRTLNRVYISKAVNSGFETPLLYNFDSHKISSEDVEKFMKLQKTVGSHTSTNSKSVKISESQLSENDKSLLKKKKNQLDTPTEKKEWNEADKAKKADAANREAIIKVLNSVSVRIPLMVFAAPPEHMVTIDNLTELIDQKSWDEFMPRGFTMLGESSSWESIKQLYDKTIFEGACQEIQQRVRAMDDMRVLNRVAAVANLFSTFKNPDRETILTSWSVVNRQYANTLGGLRMVDDDGLWFTEDSGGNLGSHSWEDVQDNELTLAPQWILVDEDLKKFWDSARTTVMDINSKTALYPLYSSLSLWYSIRERYIASFGEISREIEDEIWDEVIGKQIYLNCRVPYSKSIAQRVLAGYRPSKIRASIVDILDIRRKLIDCKVKKYDQEAVWKWLFNPKNLHTATERAIEVLTSEDLTEIVAKAKASKIDGFTATASNPPYQSTISEREGTIDGTEDVFSFFYEVANLTSDKVSMIFPGGRWMQRSAGFNDTANLIFQTANRINWYPNGDGTPESEKLFPYIRINDGISIVYASSPDEPLILNGRTISRPGDKEIVPLDKNTARIALLSRDLKDRTVRSRRGKFGFYGLRSFFVARNADKVSRVEDGKASLKDPILAWLGDEVIGSGKSVREYWVESDSVVWTPEKTSELSKWKIVMSQGGASKGPEFQQYWTVDNKHIVGETLLIVGSFNTEIEAENYRKYISSNYGRAMLAAGKGGKGSSWGAFIPDLDDYSNSNELIDFSGDITSQMLDILEATDEERILITSQVFRKIK